MAVAVRQAEKLYGHAFKKLSEKVRSIPVSCNLALLPCFRLTSLSLVNHRCLRQMVRSSACWKLFGGVIQALPRQLYCASGTRTSPCSQGDPHLQQLPRTTVLMRANLGWTDEVAHQSQCGVMKHAWSAQGGCCRAEAGRMRNCSEERHRQATGRAGQVNHSRA